MRVYTSFEQLREIQEPLFWALGFFDGMHRGHQQVISAAKQDGALCAMLSFRSHPLSLLSPHRAPQLLTPWVEQKMNYAEHYGVDVLLLLDFTPELAQMSAGEFLGALGDNCRIAGLSSGRNWHFGHRGLGDADFIEQEGARRGWSIAIAPLLEENGHIISSTTIRSLLQEGALDEASQMLGHAFTLRGEVVHGQHLARQWNYPTANIPIPSNTLHPRAGVYAVDATINGELVLGVANIGLRPTIEENVKSVLLEVHFFDWEGDLYGQVLDVSLRHFIRAEKKFASIDELKVQIASDAEVARRLLGC